ncbi:hypothetical protein [Baekduia sp. Peel2402]|uniref:hypothetical protein n=1 Tax=Baekduia sp. Peel2402 TaxID=3458296 RepID=UPI00403EBC65
MHGVDSLFAVCEQHVECPAASVCGLAYTEHACRAHQHPSDPGGEHVLHPRSNAFNDWFRALGGLDFEDVGARPLTLPTLGAYIPQIDNHRGLRGSLDGSVYAVRVRSVLRSKGVMRAAEVRERHELRADQQLILLLFDRDELLERLWTTDMVMSIALARYDVVIAPSYSGWMPRPPVESLVNAKRSLAYYAALNEAGANAVPRMLWQAEHDVDRWADWVLSNLSAVRLVAIDLQTYRSASDWAMQMEGLTRFDERTGRHLSYLVNGPTTRPRIEELHDAVTAERLHLTNATTQWGLRPLRSGQRSPLLDIRPRGSRFVMQVAGQEAMLAEAVAATRLAATG